MLMQLHANRQDDQHAYVRYIRDCLEANHSRPSIGRRVIIDWPIHLTGVARHGECSLCCCPHPSFTGAPQAPRGLRGEAVALGCQVLLIGGASGVTR